LMRMDLVRVVMPDTEQRSHSSGTLLSVSDLAASS